MPVHLRVTLGRPGRRARDEGAAAELEQVAPGPAFALHRARRGGEAGQGLQVCRSRQRLAAFEGPQADRATALRLDAQGDEPVVRGQIDEGLTGREREAVVAL